MEIIKMPLGSMGTNCYVIYDDISREAAVIDPAENGKAICDKINSLNLKLKYIIITHAHCDHICALDYVKSATNADVCIGIMDEKTLNSNSLSLCDLFGTKAPETKSDIILKDGDELHLGKNKLMIIETPGHTKGGIGIYANKMLFIGDTLFLESVGRTDFPGGSMNELINSIKNKLFILPDDTKVYPGHGDSTTIKHEKSNNPYIW